MNGKELFEGMSFVHSKYVQEAEEKPAQQSKKVIRFWKKPIVMAAIIGLAVLLMGSASGIFTILAESDLFDYPLVDTAKVPVENIHLSVDNVTSTSLRVYCDIKGVEYGKNSIYILGNGPFSIEKQTETGWEELSSNIDDPEWDADEVLTSGTYDWYVDWSAMYGILEPGTYRYVATVLEGNVPVSVEFTVEGQGAEDLSAIIDEILKGDAYYVRYTLKTEFGSLDNLTNDQKTLIKEEYMDAPFVYEYWKHGEDLLQIIYKEEHPWIGMMYKDGIKYSLDHEGDDRTNPVIGWSPNPDLNLNRLTDWASTLSSDFDGMDAKYTPEGRLESLTLKNYEEKFQGYDVEATNIHLWEFISTDPSVAATKIAEQDIDVAREFSWRKDQQNMKALDVEFVNTTAQPVTKASEAIARAMAECTVEHDKILVYRDEDAGMWKVEFQIGYGYQGYQFVYLDDDGITRMISGAGSKEELWKDLYPDP